jgi:heme-degrading monooxygenase HmoA
MFERYDERARRALFFARYETLQGGGAAIESEHLLLGVLRESEAVLRFTRDTADTIRARLARALVARERVPPSVEIPFSPSCKDVLAQTAIEADRLNNLVVRPEHIVIAILVKTDGAAAQALREAAVDPDAIRAYLHGAPDNPSERPRVQAVMSAHVAPGGIVRLWKGVVKPGLADAYIRHLREETLPSLRRLEGFLYASILRREVDEGTEFQIATVWGSLDAIEAFAGEDVTRAVVPPAAQALMVRYDDRAVHYTVVT